MILPKGSNIYMKPASNSYSEKTTKDQKIYFLDYNGNDWEYIMTEDGIEGYINMKEVK